MGIQVFKGVAQQRARLIGQRNQLLLRAARDAARVEVLEAKIRAYNIVLQAQGIDIDPDDYKPVVPHVRRRMFAHGQLSGLCLAALRTNGRPMSTCEVLNYVVREAGICFTHPRERNEVRRGIKNQLRVYARRGVVLRVGRVGPRHDDEALWQVT